VDKEANRRKGYESHSGGGHLSRRRVGIMDVASTLKKLHEQSKVHLLGSGELGHPPSSFQKVGENLGHI